MLFVVHLYVSHVIYRQPVQSLPRLSLDVCWDWFPLTGDGWKDEEICIETLWLDHYAKQLQFATFGYFIYPKFVIILNSSLCQ